MILSGNKLDGAGAEHMSNILQNNKVRLKYRSIHLKHSIQGLKKLTFTFNPFSDDTIKYIADALANNNVRHN